MPQSHPIDTSSGHEQRQWLAASHVDTILAQCVHDMLVRRPVDVFAFLQDWAAENGRGALGTQLDDSEALASKHESASPRRDEGGSGAYANEEQRHAPSELATLFPSPSAAGLQCHSSRQVGKGNYGYVLRGATLLPSSPEYAIKVVPIKATWTLDEARFTQLISDAARRMAVAHPHRVSSTSLHPASAHDVAVKGATHVLRLEGVVAYDSGTDALWIPLTWAPVTLEQCIHSRHRRKQGATGSPVMSLQTPNVHGHVAAVTGCFDLWELQEITRQLLTAVHFLTTCCGVVHLDIKPSNILLRRKWWRGRQQHPPQRHNHVPSPTARRRAEVEGVSAGHGYDDGWESDAASQLDADDPSDTDSTMSISSEESRSVSESVTSDPYGVTTLRSPPGFLHPAAAVGASSANAASMPQSAPQSVPMAGPRTRTNSDGSDDAASLHVPHVLLGDFGLVQRIGDPCLQLGDFMYMAPEVFFAKAPREGVATTQVAAVFHEAHDIWAIGVVLIHMMEGECPFTWEGTPFFDFFEENYATPMPKHAGLWPPEIVHFLALCFERDYDKRPTALSLLSHPFFQLN